MAVNLSPVGGVAAQFFDNDGNVLSGGKIYTYAAGTSTPQTTYTTGAGSIAHSNPIILDSGGRVPSGEIWLTDGISYKFVLNNASGTLIGTYDNIVGINSNFINFLAEQEIQTATAGQTVFTLTTTEYQPGTNTLSVFVDGVNQYGPGAQYAYTETSSTVVTFTNGLHVGASVKFTTTQTLSGGAIDSSQVVYDPPFTGSVATNVEAKLAQYVCVKDFGAVGDGVTDDTAAIRAAVAASQQIWFPAGTYLVDSTNTAPYRAIIEAVGDNVCLSGYGATLKYKNGVSSTLGIRFINLEDCTNALVEGFVFEGNKNNQNAGYTSVEISGGFNITLRDLVINDSPYDGIYCRASTVNDFDTYPTNVYIENVIVDNASRNGISIIGVNGLTMRNLRLRNIDGDPGAGIDFEPNVSDIYGIRNVLVDGVLVENNYGRGIVVTGNAPTNPGETPFVLNIKLSNIVAKNNGTGADPVVKGCDIGVFRCEDFMLDGYMNTGQTTDPVDNGLIYIYNTAERVFLNNLYFSDVQNPTNTKYLVYVDSGATQSRAISNVFAYNCAAIVVGGGTTSNINGVYAQGCSGNSSIIVGTSKSTLKNATLINTSRVLAYSIDGCDVENVSVVDGVGIPFRIYADNSKFNNVNIWNTGTASNYAAWFESLTNCVLSNWTISDDGGYWATVSNVYDVTQLSVFGNYFRNMIPSPLSGSTTWNPASIASGGSTSTTVSLLRADAGDACVVKNSVSLQGLIEFASVTSANTATVTLFNPTGSAVDLATHIVSVEAIK